MKKALFILVVLFFLPTFVFSGNIFIEEGDLFTKTGIRAQSALSRVKAGGGVAAVVKDIDKYKGMGFTGKLKPGDKIKLMNEGKDEWTIRDIKGGQILGRLHILF